MRAALECVTSHAAVSLHLPRKGSLASGFDGDVVLFDPHAVRRVEALRWRGAGRPPLCGAKKSV